ncbi:MAG: hypothetical protein M1823_000540 [Watsoniomyces obsoletus]|nr:MAG: hypothetical protein M1823_000540 [Watsoniomyces obsoletus]
MDPQHQRPPTAKHARSTPSFHSPVRHHQRQASTPRRVKETLNARSEFSNSSDDGQWQHRINQYIIKQEIGRGSFGAVHLAVDQHGTEYAVKEFSKSRLRKRARSNILRRAPGDRRRPGHLAPHLSWLRPTTSPDMQDVVKDGDPLNLIREEIAIMKKLNHPNLVALYEVLDDPAEDSLYMVLEMCKKGVVMRLGVDDLADPYEDERCRHFFRDLMLGIEYLHAQGVVHRDIKPDNCLLTHDDVLKVVDFGVSEMFEKQSEMLTAKSAGSPAFLPPELCVARHGDVSGKAADIWSMGVTLYCLRFGRIPFAKGAVLDLYDSIRQDEVSMDEDVDPDLRDLFQRILEKDPTKRIRMDELREHPWVTRHGEDSLLSAEENTANLVEPPTEEEMQSAITGNILRLMTVMRAVKKFKHLAARKLGRIPSDEFLDHMVQPPGSMSPRDIGPPIRRTQSLFGDDRDASERAQNHPVESMEELRNHPPPDLPSARVHDDHDDEDVTQKTSPSPESHPQGTPVGRGQAHDFHDDEPTLLDVGPGEPNEGAEDMVSESPTGIDFNIFAAAYRDEVERIRRAQGRAATVYLTRRVEGASDTDPGGGGGGGERASTTDDGSRSNDRPKVRWGNLLSQTRKVVASSNTES